jgi:hypothetical protein
MPLQTLNRCLTPLKVALVTIIDGDHLPYFIQDLFPIKTTEMVWEFVSRFSRETTTKGSSLARC